MKKLLFLVMMIAGMSLRAAPAGSPSYRNFYVGHFSFSNYMIYIGPGAVDLTNLSPDIYIFIESNIFNTAYSIISTNNFTVTNAFKGILINPTSQQTNFWIDHNLTNSTGDRAMYQSIKATNNVNFFGDTNFIMSDLLSLGIVASGGNRLITVTTNFAQRAHMRTNGWSFIGTRWLKTLTNGNIFRASMRTNENDTLELTWQNPEQ